MTDARTIGTALREATTALGGAGIENARGEARILVGNAVRLAPPAVPLQPNRPLSPVEWLSFREALARRCDRRPMAQVLGRREFWSLSLAVTRDTLDPRADSETLVAAALDAFPDRDAPLSVLDLGTGTGCLLLSVLSERPRATGLGVDISAEALAVARANARANDLESRATFRRGDWTTGIQGRFDLVLANPPYIRSADIDDLAPEISRHEPRIALDGGPDGLSCYRALAPGAAALLAPSGRLAIEIGYDQADSASRILVEAGLAIESVKRDLSGNDRCLVARAAGLIAC